MRKKRQRSWAADDPRKIWLLGYRPRLGDKSLWDGGLGDFVREHVERLDGGMPTTRRLALVVAKLGAWCQEQGIALDVEAVFDPDTCARFIEYADPLGRDASLATYRADLRRIGPLLTKAAPWEPRPRALSRPSLLPPYSETEEGLIRRAVLYQSTVRRSQAARAVVALGLGAGLDGRWNWKIRAEDVERDSFGVLLYVPPPQERVVRVREAFEDEIDELADFAGSGALTGSKGRDKNVPNLIASQTRIDQGRITLDSRRLRSTWLVAHLSAGTHLRVLMDAAGIRTLDALRDLVPYIATVADADAAEQLRWA